MAAPYEQPPGHHASWFEASPCLFICLPEKTACQLAPLKTALSRCVYYGCASDLHLYQTSLTKYILAKFRTPKVGDGRKNVRAHTLPPYVVYPYYMSYHKLWCATYPWR